MTSDFQRPLVTLDYLRELVLRYYPTPHPLAEAHLAAFVTTGRIMGRHWTERWFCEFSKNNDPGMFFRPNEDVEDQHVTWRQVRFGELLFNLQHLDRFEDRQAEWQGDPEAAVAELESAYYMIACGHRPSFNPPDTNDGKTHDFDVDLSWGGRAAWEAKARLETTEYSSKSLNNVLKKARKQLPKEVHNIILVRIPESWSLEDGFESRMIESADYLFRNSGNRAISLIYHWELWTTNQGEENSFGLAGMEVVNMAWEIVNPGRRVVAGYRGFPRGWVSFLELRSGR